MEPKTGVESKAMRSLFKWVMLYKGDYVMGIMMLALDIMMFIQ